MADQDLTPAGRRGLLQDQDCGGRSMAWKGRGHLVTWSPGHLVVYGFYGFYGVHAKKYGGELWSTGDSFIIPWWLCWGSWWNDDQHWLLDHVLIGMGSYKQQLFLTEGVFLLFFSTCQVRISRFSLSLSSPPSFILFLLFPPRHRQLPHWYHYRHFPHQPPLHRRTRTLSQARRTRTLCQIKCQIKGQKECQNIF